MAHKMTHTDDCKQEAPTLSVMPNLACRPSNCLCSSWLSFVSSSCCNLHTQEGNASNKYRQVINYQHHWQQQPQHGAANQLDRRSC